MKICWHILIACYIGVVISTTCAVGFRPVASSFKLVRSGSGCGNY